MYEEFAAVYDSLMTDVDYVAWAAYYRNLMLRQGVNARRVVECACGTGSLTLPLSRMGLTMTGVDMSSAMLMIAAQKARKQGASVPFVCQDMRKLRMHRPMECVMATCDGVNYLTSPGDVKAFFKSAYEALLPGGLLLFDVSTEYKYENILGQNAYGDDREDFTYLWLNRYDKKTRLCSMLLSFFTPAHGGLYSRFDERQLHRAHSEGELRAWLEECGFINTAVYGDKHFFAPSPTEERMHIAAQKPEAPKE
ncbi:MAG: class I SAM-dependent methyltransferase [Eubacteriales bacterium]|nr:class I SAM-dependent methyltransferase [Eubacteriales bacterium]MDD3882519.1 class I SAM-dependent methyltransferase [Eubacteriales bacterium]MDD4512819.1 class I SAM-dependent methyltransferase [Eubacteriales bacterium]